MTWYIILYIAVSFYLVGRSEIKRRNLLAELKGTWSYWSIVSSKENAGNYSKEILSDISKLIKEYE